MSLPAATDPARSGSDPAQWRPYGLALLPLCLAGLLPSVQVALLCGVYALGVRSAEWVHGRLLLGVLVVAGGSALQAGSVLHGSQSELIGLAASALLGLIAVILLHLGATRIEAGHRSGLLVPLGLGLLAPQALLLPALAGGALARPTEDDRPAAWHVAPGAAAWRWPVMGLLGVTLLMALLPRGPSVWAMVTRHLEPVPTAGAPVQVPPPAAEPVLDRPRTTLNPSVAQTPLQITLDHSMLPLELVLMAAVGLGISLLWRARPRAVGVPPTLVERLMAIGLIVGGLVGLGAALLLSISSGGGGGAVGSVAVRGGSALGSQVPSLNVPVRTLDLSLLMNVMVAVSVLLLAGLTVAAFLARRDEAPDDLPELSLEDAAESLEPGRPAAPLHRVRRAWRAAEAALEATGRSRLPAESPLSYAARLGRDAPLLRAPLAALARVYAPVRYGAQVSETGAGTAERALTELRVIIPTLPPPRPADAKGTP
ncbi:DUF4129 domain-containing protein [Deinococcus sp. KSM4-11]|uniref:DUF4129 domain-containing protein n=1 Tax=Deinococcus sp. KSM4-11 TaxID=2568654 RepID=UPI0010A485AD|nr:DUF4129 domain-containing protein [Deinococcus sp. KSM4-11]THF87970.1 DUF4129 domain-containing protein [Deinococcus sp. KSM4-11]